MLVIRRLQHHPGPARWSMERIGMLTCKGRSFGDDINIFNIKIDFNHDN